MRVRPASLKVRALQWLAQREHSPAELRAKLLHAAAGRRVALAEPPPVFEGPTFDAADEAFEASALEPDPAALAAAQVAEVEALLGWLSAHGYLSAERFVESRVHARQSRFGTQHIAHELRQHGLGLDSAAQQALQATELARAREVWERKFGTPSTDAAGRIRQMRFLAGRGFSHEAIRQLVRGGTHNSDD